MAEFEHRILITNVIGNPLYSDMDNTLGCMILTTLQQYVASGLHGLHIKCLKSENWQIVMEQVLLSITQTVVYAMFRKRHSGLHSQLLFRNVD